VEVYSTHSLTAALDGGEWSASRPGRFTPRGRSPGTHWIGGWVGPRAVLDVVVERKIVVASRSFIYIINAKALKFIPGELHVLLFLILRKISQMILFQFFCFLFVK
jgi:hypothetical protein